jgi:hypothetical protein
MKIFNRKVEEVAQRENAKAAQCYEPKATDAKPNSSWHRFNGATQWLFTTLRQRRNVAKPKSAKRSQRKQLDRRRAKHGVYSGLLAPF